LKAAVPECKSDLYQRAPQGSVYAFHVGDGSAKVRSASFPKLSYAAVSDGSGSAAAIAATFESPPVGSEIAYSAIGSVGDVERVAIREKVDLVVLSLSERRGQMPLRELLNLKFLGVQVEEAHNMYERVAGRILLDRLSPSWLILSEGFRKSQALLAAKRIGDVVIAIIALVITAPLAVLVAIAVFLESGRPLLFRQPRVGLHGRTFQINKFRSMRHESTPAKQTWASDEDPRITRVGRFIRKFRLDEIPQLINVLLGEMSLIGPRPEQPALVQMLEQEIPYYRQRHSLRPGITGWAQVKCGYGATVQESRMKLEYDLFYIKHLSMVLDLVILFETGTVMLLVSTNGCFRDPVVRAESDYKRAEKYLRENKPDAAVIELRRALQLNPQLAKAHVALGALELQRGSMLTAFQEFYAASVADPDDPQAQIMVAELLARAHNFTQSS